MFFTPSINEGIRLVLFCEAESFTKKLSNDINRYFSPIYNWKRQPLDELNVLWDDAKQQLNADIMNLDALKNPTAYPHPTASIELIETNILIVVLTGQFAYKIKKPGQTLRILRNH